ncbi:MAG: M4 family metallopeptidase [Myxococcales bacterium]|nr:M4 family metallopeptidase [Myxococcales bacterium]
MRPPSVPVLLVVACSGPEVATDPDGSSSEPTTTAPSTSTPEPTEPGPTPFDGLQAASDGPVTWHVAHGVPATVSLQVPVASADPIEQSWTFLERFAELYRLPQPRTQLFPRSTRQDGSGHHVRFVQRSLPEHGGLPLLNGGLSVHVGDDVVYLTSGRWVPELVSEAPQLSAADALDAVVFEPELRDFEVRGEPRLGIYADWTRPGAPELHTVWRATVEGRLAKGAEPVSWQVDVSATTGQLVHHVSLQSSCNQALHVGGGSHDEIGLCWVGADLWFDEDGVTSGYSATADHNLDGSDLNAHVNTVYDYFDQELSYCSYDGSDAVVVAVSHADVANASASTACDTIQFRDGFVHLDVVAHEFAHLVDAANSDLQYEGQSGALDESFADVFASLVDGNWLIGEDLSGGAIRSLANPPAFGDPDHMQASLSGDGAGLRSTANPNGDNDWGNVHTNSGIPNKAAFLVTVGGVHNGYVVEGLGRDKAQHLYHAVHTGMLDGDASFVDARNALVGAAVFWGAVGWFGFDEDDYCEVGKAFASVGVAVAQADNDCDGTLDGWDGDDDSDGIPDGSDNCPLLYNPAQDDQDLDGLGGACDSDKDGDGVDNRQDNCVGWVNPAQIDSDGDGVGDACDDEDGDGVLDVVDNCPDDPNWHQQDTDDDGQGDACDPDIDGDGLANASDNCPEHANGDQGDADEDTVGDPCDNCPDTPNVDQQDCDGDGMGHACDFDVFEQGLCEDWFELAMSAYVDPLDEVTLPHVTWKDPVSREGYRLGLTVEGTTQPWLVRDHRGRVVARSQPVAGARVVQEAVWVPALDYHLRDDEQRVDFATDYALQLGPFGSGIELDITVQALQAGVGP